MDPYYTHLEPLEDVISFLSPGTAVEFGMGHYSTPLLIRRIPQVMSVEMQDAAWYDEMKRHFGQYPRWNGVLDLSASDFCNLEYPALIDLALVDGHGDSRSEVVNFLMERNCGTIVAHDTEAPAYGWDRIRNTSYLRIRFTKYPVETTVFTKDGGLHSRLKSLPGYCEHAT